jgi:hypothetical protein
MDPKANLAEQSRLSAELIAILDRFDDHTKIPIPETCAIIALADRLAELSRAYCEWIKKGGFPA